jgi:hypothetical protein
LPITAPEAPVTQAPVPVESQTEGDATGEDSSPEVKPEDRARKLENALSRKRQQLADARAEREHLRRQLDEYQRRLTPGSQEDNNRPSDADSEVVSLTRAQLREREEAAARKLAPTLAQQDAAEASRRKAAQEIVAKIGAEKFNELANEIVQVMPEKIALRIMDSKAPQELLQYLADPDNEAEAAAIGRLDEFRAGEALAELRIKLAERKDRPQVSKSAAIVEPVRGSAVHNGAPDPKDTKAWVKWANEQERKGLL